MTRSVADVYEPVILFIYDDAEREAAGLLYRREAAGLGFRALSADCRAIQLAPRGIVLLEGREVSAGGATRTITEEHVVPDVVVHRALVEGPCEDLFTEMMRSERPLCSYHPIWKAIGDKWTMETDFQEADRRGVTVPRPRTYLCENRDLARALADVGRTRTLIFKPSAGSLCEGIRLSSPSNFVDVAEEVSRSAFGRYVTQDLVDDVVLCEGRRFDLRVYALVTSFKPLHFTVLREGVARLAARAWDPANPADPLSVLTGHKYRLRQGVTAANGSISDLLRRLGQDGLDTSKFWDEAEQLLGRVFAALTWAGALEVPADLGGHFYLAGTDLVMVSRGSGHALLFLETNYAPDLAGWGGDVDLQLRPAYRQWLGKLRTVWAEEIRMNPRRDRAESLRSWSSRRR